MFQFLYPNGHMLVQTHFLSFCTRIYFLDFFLYFLTQIDRSVYYLNTVSVSGSVACRECCIVHPELGALLSITWEARNRREKNVTNLCWQSQTKHRFRLVWYTNTQWQFPLAAGRPAVRTTPKTRLQSRPPRHSTLVLREATIWKCVGGSIFNLQKRKFENVLWLPAAVVSSET